MINDLAVNSFPTLVVFCKKPAVGQGKSRLAATIGAEDAYRVAIALLNCALEDAAAWPGPLVFTVSNTEDICWAENLLGAKYQVICQGEGNLGQRINGIDNQLRSQGHTHLAFIGTDAPMLTHQHYLDVQQKLTQFDIVLSPADDGGVGIMANAQPWPNLSALPWSTDRLGSALEELCQQQNYSVEQSLASFDIDEYADLAKTYQALKNDNRCARLQLRKRLAELIAVNPETAYE
jgi:glycosyltransferase A (GT-A) superfamily protein (DUF2064 family)